jgi:hypothetical protein
MTRSSHPSWFYHLNNISSVQVAKVLVIKLSTPPILHLCQVQTYKRAYCRQTHVTVFIGISSVIQPCLISGKGPLKFNGE